VEGAEVGAPGSGRETQGGVYSQEVLMGKQDEVAGGLEIH
jgi:hypothetical protein